VAGGVLVVCGFVLIAWSAFTFRRFGTSLNPWRGVRALVVSGPYRVSRNPVYAGDVLIHAGIGLLLNNGWILVTLLPAILVMQYGVILREERYLKKRFGDRYLAYCKHVRRWL
jgi:protein-S-isoprenylcysteine O-methyltransferase Ste14